MTRHRSFTLLCILMIVAAASSALAEQPVLPWEVGAEPAALMTPFDLATPPPASGMVERPGAESLFAGTSASCPPPRSATTNDYLCMPQEHGQSTPTCDDCDPGVENICCDCICYCLNGL